MRNYSSKKSYILALIAALLTISLFGQGDPGDPGEYKVTLKWGATGEAGVTGYKIYYSTEPDIWRDKAGVMVVEAGDVNEFQLALDVLAAEGQSYYAAVTAVNAAGLESPFSNEVRFSNFDPSAPVDLRVTASEKP